ncbi:MAG: MmcQ/YjbR family DNA-binding protein [Flavobacteriales bacterium]|nr:MmcQ/YjbR family DNA-binding protein [Flavobacteriales bacterium]
MTFDSFFDYCSSKKGVQETFPFDETTLVFKVGGKMFALTDTEEFISINLKCDPEKAIELRERFMAIQPGYHMSKKHWNTVQLHSDVDDKLLFELIDHSYQLIVDSLPKKVRNEIEMG